MTLNLKPITSQEVAVQDILDEQNQESGEYAIKFLAIVLRLCGTRIERAQFLEAEAHKRGSGQAEIARAI